MKQRRTTTSLVGLCLIGLSVAACGDTDDNGDGGQAGGGSLCETANTYAYYVSAMNGQQGVQPNGDDLKTALTETEDSAGVIASKTDGSVQTDAEKMVDYWSKMTKTWGEFDYDTRKVTQADLPKFKLPGYQQPGERVLQWTVDTCGDKITPFPQRPN